MAQNLRTITYEIPESFCGRTVEAFLRSKSYSKHVIIHCRNTETVLPGTSETLHGILLNGRKAFAKKELSAGDILTIHLLETEASPNVVETDIPLSILYEDEDLLVINKQAGLPVHPSMGHFEYTLGNALCYYTHHTLHYDQYVYRVINRLDRDTSGLLIAAKNMLSAAVLGDMVKNREIRRTYLAVCSGNICDTAGFLDKPGVSAESDPELSVTVSVPLGRKEGSVVERCVDFTDGETAVTHFSPLAYDAARDLSLLRLKLETGRTHQIRVHMKYIGHPLIGDFLYNPDYRYMNRQSLHSHALFFRQPVTGQELSFTAPLPPDMAALFPDFNS